jgi:hypothetical protein
LDKLNTVLVEVEGTLNARPLTDEYEEFDGEVLRGCLPKNRPTSFNAKNDFLLYFVHELCLP